MLIKRNAFIAILTAVTLTLTTTIAVLARESVGIALPIVMYHHLSTNPKSLGDYVISVAQLESDIKYLKENGYETVSTKQLTAAKSGKGKLPKKPCMITFDDGFESTYAYALPLLKKYNMCAVVSVIGKETQKFTELEDHNLAYSYMNWNSVKLADKSNSLEVQCHTNAMHDLWPRRGCNKNYGESHEKYKKALQDDICAFQNEFKSVTGHTATAIALPYGSYCSETIEIMKSLGFNVIFTCTQKVNYLKGSDEELLELGRFNRPSGITSEKFFERFNP